MPKKPRQDRRAQLVQIVRTPLGFSVLALLITEVICLAGIPLTDQKGTIIFVAVLAAILLTILVIGTAIFRPEALQGERPASSDQTAAPLVAVATPSPATTSIKPEWLQNVVAKELSRLEVCIASIINDNEMDIYNPFMARDISLKIIETSQPEDKVIASMNFADRPFLLQPSYTINLLSLHRNLQHESQGRVTFTRVLIANDHQRTLPDYQAFISELKLLGVAVLDCAPQSFIDNGFHGDVIVRQMGNSKTDRICVEGDKDSTNPVDEYKARLLLQDHAEIDNYIKKFTILINRLKRP